MNVDANTIAAGTALLGAIGTIFFAIRKITIAERDVAEAKRKVEAAEPRLRALEDRLLIIERDTTAHAKSDEKELGEIKDELKALRECMDEVKEGVADISASVRAGRRENKDARGT